MAELDFIIILAVVLLVVIVPMILLGSMSLRRYMLRDHVWYAIDLKNGRTVSGHTKPDKRGLLETPYGQYFTRADTFTLTDPGFFNPRRVALFRYAQGQPFPYKYATKKVTVISANPGHAVTHYESYMEPQVIPAETVETFFKQKIFADAYAGGRGLIWILIGIGLLVILVIGLYARR